MFDAVFKWLCERSRHKPVMYLDGTVRCARCGEEWNPPSASDTIHAMREADPEWWSEYQGRPPHIALDAFAKRNPNYGEIDAR